MGVKQQNLKAHLARAAAIGALALGLAVVGSVGPGPAGFGAAFAQEADLAAEGQAAVAAYMGALVAGDKAAIEAVLAPEFQAMRSEGGGYDRASYLAEGLPVIPKMPAITDLVATASDGLLVTRYTLEAEVSTDGVARTAKAPRLTVFRKQGEVWLVVAHANFSQLAE